MTPEGVLTMGNQAMQVAALVAAPILLVVLGIGLMVSIFQAATQINEQTLTFIPKLLGVLIALAVAGPWMLEVLVDYMRAIFTSIPTLAV